MRRVENPPNPYESSYRTWIGPPPRVSIEVYEEEARSILSENDSPDLSFRWSVNPYRGCQHACAYCYARPYHEYLGYGAGTDFDTKLVAKVNAADLLATGLGSRKWKREGIVFSGVTDCYQPYEIRYGLTRACIEVCRRFRNPLAIVTKSCLVRRDAELLADHNRVAGAMVYMSIPFAKDETADLIEPHAPPPSLRFEAIRCLRDAGVPVGVLVAPIIPGLNDCEIPEILERSADMGVSRAGFAALRLPGSVEQIFWERVRRVMPDRASRIEHRIRDIRSGGMSDSRFGRRMRGEGVYWDSIKDLFNVSARRFGLRRSSDESPFRKIENSEPQLSFDFG